MTKLIVPQNNGEGGIGESTKAWGQSYFTALTVNGQAVNPLVAVTLNPSAGIQFQNSGRTYRVILSWNSSLGEFLPFGPVSQKVTATSSPPVNPFNSLWIKEDSFTSTSQIGWEVYIPASATYGAVTTLNVSVQALGNWSNLSNLVPICYWSTPVLVV